LVLKALFVLSKKMRISPKNPSRESETQRPTVLQILNR
jgi:hypothetical protein